MDFGPREMRTGAALLGKTAGLLLELADAEERGDRETQQQLIGQCVALARVLLAMVRRAGL